MFLFLLCGGVGAVLVLSSEGLHVGACKPLCYVMLLCYFVRRRAEQGLPTQDWEEAGGRDL